MPAGRPTLYKPEYCQMVIDHMAKGNSFWSFAADINVHFDTLSEWTKAHPEFSEAKKIGVAKLLKFDEELNKAGSAGLLRRVSREEFKTDEEGNTTKIVYHEPAHFAQTYRIFLMKNRYPRLYRDKIEVETKDSDSVKKSAQKIKEIMNDPKLREAAEALADKLSDEEQS